MSRYVERTIEEFRSVLEPPLFRETTPDDCTEYVFETDITTPKVATGFTILIYSSVDVRTGRTKECADDAIRFCIRNNNTGTYTKYPGRVYRTANALENTIQRARDIFAHVFRNRCSCGGFLVKRKAKKSKEFFMGCSSFPACKKTAQKCKLCDNTARYQMDDPNDRQPFPVDGEDALCYEAPETWNLCKTHYEECLEM